MTANQLSAIVGRNVRTLRLMADMTQTAVAQAADIAPAYVCQIEAGERRPSLKLLVRLADALGTEPHVLLRPDPAGEWTISEVRAALGRCQKVLRLYQEKTPVHKEEEEC